MKIWNRVLQETFIPLRIHQLLEAEHGMKETRVSNKELPLGTVEEAVSSFHKFHLVSFVIESIWIIFLMK